MQENPKVIQQLLGHKDVTTTIRTYNSVDKSYSKQATKKIDGYVRRRYGDVTKQKEYRGGCHTAAALLFKELLLGLIVKAHLI